MAPDYSGLDYFDLDYFGLDYLAPDSSALEHALGDENDIASLERNVW